MDSAEDTRLRVAGLGCRHRSFSLQRIYSLGSRPRQTLFESFLYLSLSDDLEHVLSLILNQFIWDKTQENNKTKGRKEERGEG